MVEVKAGAFRWGTAGVGDKMKTGARCKDSKTVQFGKYEVTFDEYDRFALTTGRALPGDQGWGRGQRPVINVSWEDAREFANWLSEHWKTLSLTKRSRVGVRRASGGKAEIWAGTSDENAAKRYAWYSRNSSGPN